MITTAFDETKKEELANLAHEMMGSKEKILDNVFYRLMSSKNSLNRVSEHYVGDYDKVFAIRLTDDADGISSIVLTWEILDGLGIDFDSIKEAAERNTPSFSEAVIEPMFNMLASLVGSDIELSSQEGAQDLYVLTNTSKLYGASAICYEGMLEKCSSMLGSFWVLPSSLHEVILVPCTMGADTDSLRQMVREVNDSIVEPRDILGYQVLFYDAITRTLEVA